MLAINSSPRKEKGNTALILTPFLEGLKEAGAEVELYYTGDLKITPCKGEVSCWLKTPGKCILDDDMRWLAPKAIRADLLVLATPVYCDGITSGMQMVLERLLSRALPSLELREGHTRHPHREAANGKLALVSSCGLWELDNFDAAVAQVKGYCRNADIEFTGALLRPHGLFLKPMLDKGAPVADVPEAARRAGCQLASEGRMSQDTLDIVSRPLLPRDQFVQIFNRQVAGQSGGTSARPSPAVPEPKEASATQGPNRLAERMAMIRAAEAKRPADERVCYDQYAVRFVGLELGALLALGPEQFDLAVPRLEQGMPGLTNSAVARARFFDETVAQAVANGLEQLVVLGAGYDTRAYRIPGVDKARVFEVDQPATVEAKKAKIREVFGSLPGHVAYVPIDFNVEKLETKLPEAGYDPAKKTLFTLEGLIMYLKPAAVDGLMAFIAQNRRAAVAFDYGRIDTGAAATTHRQEGQAIRQFVKGEGDVMRFAVAGPVEEFLAKRGFSRVRNMTHEDYHKAYFTGKSAGRQVSGLLWFAYGEV